MRSLGEPDAQRGRGVLWILLVFAAVGGALAWYAANRSAETTTSSAPPVTAAAPIAPPTTRNDTPASTERPPARGDGPATPRPPRSTPPARSPDAAAAGAAATARQLRVTSDVPGAYVFLDRKFLGTTPVTAREVTPGSHQLNVQVEGRPPVVQTVTILEQGPTEVEVTLPPAPSTTAAAAAVSADVAVVHQHGVGSCDGVLRATAGALRYETSHKDAFSVPLASVETFTVDYQEKRLRLKQRGGRTWNFTTRAATADPLFVFHRDVDAGRSR